MTICLDLCVFVLYYKELADFGASARVGNLFSAVLGSFSIAHGGTVSDFLAVRAAYCRNSR
jgi:hypothetical protein